MNKRLLRVYQNLDINDVKEHLLIFGDLSGQCSQCNHLEIKMETPICPSCRTEFKYLSFRNIKDHLPKIQKLLAENHKITLIDYDDYKRLTGALKAQEFLK